MSVCERDYIIRCAADLGVGVTEEQARLLLSHLDTVLEANQRLNLTAITDRYRGVRLHIVDSLAVLPYVGSAEGSAADIGSGAGFPGIPVAIVAERPLDLIESIKKRAVFLEACVRLLGGLWGTEVLPLRAEEAAESHACSYTCVMARALTSLPALVELASPLLAIGGRLVAMKGAPTVEELRSGEDAARMVGMEESQRVEYRLPELGETRTLVCYTRVGQSEVPLPRRVGLAQKRPLA